MAGSRIEKLGTIFTRLEGLLRTGAVKFEERPIWYDVYKAFPPTVEPQFFRGDAPNPDKIRQIFYKEDMVRARFYKEVGRSVTIAERFLADYQKHLSNGTSEDDAFQLTKERYQQSKSKHTVDRPR